MERSKDIDFFASVKVRACPGLTLVVRDQLSAADQDAFAAWQGKDSVYGVLVRRSGQGGVRIAVSPEVALLFLTLTEPATVPRYAQERFGRHWRDTIDHQHSCALPRQPRRNRRADAVRTAGHQRNFAFKSSQSLDPSELSQTSKSAAPAPSSLRPSA